LNGRAIKLFDSPLELGFFTLAKSVSPTGRQWRAGRSVSSWPIATDDALTANRRFRGIANMKRFSAPDDL